MELPPPPSSGSSGRSAKQYWQPPSPEDLEAQLPLYKVIEILGHGGMGAVYKGWQVSLDRHVAIKILPPDLDGGDANFAARFQQEAKTMARLSHPGIVHVHDAGKTLDGLLYFVMEFIEGTDVSRMIKRQGLLPPEHALAITAHVCDALEYAHGQGVIHRDIKPANVMVNTQGAVKVADFGLAKLITWDDGGLTKTSMAMGTPDYMAPEALIEGETVDQRADTYAVGVMLYQMLTGMVPRGVFPPPSQKIAGLDPRYDQIVLKAMQIDREHRYSSASAIRLELDRILSHPVPKEKPLEAPVGKPPVEARRIVEPARPITAGKKTNGRLWIWGSLLMAAFILGSFFLGGPHKTDSKSDPPPVPANTSVTNDSASPVQASSVADSPKTSRLRDSQPGPISVQSDAKPPTLVASQTGTSESVNHPAPSIQPPTPIASVPDAPSHPAPAGGPKASDPSTTPASPTLPREVTERLTEIRAAYDNYVSINLTKPHEIAVAALEANYVKALRRTSDDAAKRGDLEGVVAAKSEIELIAKHQPLPPSEDGLPAAIKNLRVTFRSEYLKLEQSRDAKIPDANQRYDTALAQYQIQLTQARQVEAAVQVKALRNSSVGNIPSASWTNSLGMRFVPVPGTKVMFCIHDTRKRDYRSFANYSQGRLDDAWKNVTFLNVPVSDGEEYPVVMVSWEDAKAFCNWLTAKEGKTYRLPTDHEWSCAVGIGAQEDPNASPKSKSGKIDGIYPWGKQWPPPKGAGNLADSACKSKFSSMTVIDGYSDEFATTSPVMHFEPNKLGIYDLAGNVWQYCEDWYDSDQNYRVLRGGSWSSDERLLLRSSYRAYQNPTYRYVFYGFRVVLAQ